MEDLLRGQKDKLSRGTMVASHTFNKGYIKNSQNSRTFLKVRNPIRIWTKSIKRHVNEEDIQISSSNKQTSTGNDV